jgi:nucleoside-diphosphate-sugar epimerase
MKLNGKKIVVVGGSGLIGSNLVAKLRELGAKVESWNSRDHDIRQASKLDFKGVDYVFHLAAKMSGSEKEIYGVNLEGTKNVVEKAIEAGVEKLIYVSTVMVFEDTGKKEADERYKKRKSHENMYADSKNKALELVNNYINKLPIVVVYPTVVLNNGGGLLGSGKIMSLVGSRERVTNYVNVDELTDLLIKALVFGKTGEDYILGGRNISAGDFWWLGRFIRIPNFVAKLILGNVPVNMCFSSKKIKSVG